MPEFASNIKVRENQIPVLQDRDEWQLLQRLLHRLPAGLVAQNPALLLAQAWIYDFFMQTARMRVLLVQIKELLAMLRPHLEPGRWLRLQSEADLLGVAAMLTVSSIEETKRSTAAALIHLPADDLFLRSKVLLFLACQLQRHGLIDFVLERLDEEYSGVAQSFTYLVRLLFARHMVLIHEGRMIAARYSIDPDLRLAEQTALPLTLANAHLSAASIY